MLTISALNGLELFRFGDTCNARTGYGFYIHISVTGQKNKFDLCMEIKFLWVHK